MPELVNLWSGLEPSLAADDDPALWRAVVGVVYADASALCRLVPAGWAVVTELGACSHWLRPHRTRWTADGGFAWPTGYGGRPGSRTGLPGFNWHRAWSWRRGPKLLLFRVAVPSRSRRRRQAAVHTVWQPGKPFGCRADIVQFYGFRRRPGGDWVCTAYRAESPGAEALYRRAADEANA